MFAGSIHADRVLYMRIKNYLALLPRPAEDLGEKENGDSDSPAGAGGAGRVRREAILTRGVTVRVARRAGRASRFP